jgi:nitroimidazol reductase NimA-like FMN-containing flavoprotein (pyridoxamine 5'-phosphate oxidase superfamily)
MTPEQIDSFLQTERTLILVTLRADGTPVAHPMWFAKLGDAVYDMVSKPVQAYCPSAQ